MIFRKKMPRQCAYCAFATTLDESFMLCSKKGMVSCQKKCMKFRYDPCKRIPPRPKALDFSKYNEKDYSL